MMERYTLDLVIVYEPTEDSCNSRYNLSIRLPRDTLRRWCLTNLSELQTTSFVVVHWRLEDHTLIVDIESYNPLGHRGKEVKRHFLNWLTTELRKEYGADVIKIYHS